MRTPRVDAPSRSDWFVAGLSRPFGGPLGDHAVRTHNRAWLAAGVVLALTCVTLALHMAQKSPCADGRWANLEQLTRFCYSDIIPLYSAEGGLSVGGIPYLNYALEYPVLTGAFMTVIGLPVHELVDPQSQHQWFYLLTAGSLLVFAVAAVATMLGLRQRRPWDIAMFAVAPALLLTATVNWDLLAVLLAVAGIYAWARRHPVAAGILLGLGTAAKLWPGFLFLALIVLGLRTRQNRLVWNSVAAGVLTWVAVNLPVMAANFENWSRFLQLNTERAVDWGTFWYIGRYLESHLLSGREAPTGGFQWFAAHVDPHLNWASYALFGLACVGIAALALYAPRRPRLAALAFLTVAAFLLFGKVWSQQFVLWLLPLVVLARPRWGAFLAWQAAEVCYFFTFYGQLILATPQDQRPEGVFVMPEGWFIIAASLRWLTVAALCGLVVRDILRPRQDPVRDSYADDPDGGPFNGAADYRLRWKTILPWISSLVRPSSTPAGSTADAQGVPATLSGSTTTEDTPSERR